MTLFVVVNGSTLVPDADASLMTQAVAMQVRDHVAPAWGRVPPDVVFVPKGGTVPEDAFPVYLLDDADQAGLGYHTEDPNGRRYGRAFARPVLDNKGSLTKGSLSVSACLSHEVLEAFIDPACQLWADRLDGTFVAYECADPVENDSYVVRVTVDGRLVDVSVSSFVTADWFDAVSKGARYDWLGHLTRPLQVSIGGYVVVLDGATGKTSQVFGSHVAQRTHDAIKPTHVAARSSRRLR